MFSPEQISRLRRYMELRDRRDETKKAAKEAEEEFRESESLLFEELTDEEHGAPGRIPPVDIGPPWGRVSFSARETYYGRIIPGMEDQALTYFEQRALADELTAPKIVMKRLNAIVRDAIEQGRPEDLPPGVDWYANRGVTVTQQKGT